MSLDRVWLTAKRASLYLDYDDTPNGLKAFREMARQKKDTLVPHYIGRSVRYAKADLDRLLIPALRIVKRTKSAAA